MPVHPALEPVLDAMSQAILRSDDGGAGPIPGVGNAGSVAEARTAAHGMIEATVMALGENSPPAASEVDHRVPVDGGEIWVRVYTPEGRGPFPCHLYIHGGGFWVGTLDQADSTCRSLVAGAGCVAVSVDYRLAPEAKFPVPLEDCYTALQWVVDHADELGVDPSRISVGGDSAGGNLSAVLALLARDRGGPPLVLQVLEIPVTDFTMSQPSIDSNDGYLLTRAGMEQCRDYYLADLDDATNPYASPLLAEDLSGLPPALVMTMEFDPLRDEGEAYAARLADAGVPVEVVRWAGHFHGSITMAKLVPDDALAYRESVVAALLRAYSAS
jgi:acetyl esterase